MGQKGADTTARRFGAQQSKFAYEGKSSVRNPANLLNDPTESPLIQREGCVEDQGIYKEFKKRTLQGELVPTNRQWREIQIATATDPTDTVHNRVGVHQVIIDDKLMHQREYMGVKVVLPV